MAKILLIEDTVELRELIENFISQEHEVVCALKFTLDEIAALVETVDLVVCDYNFHPQTKFEHVRELVGSKPIVLCSAEEGDYFDSIPNRVRKTEITKALKPTIAALLKGAA